MNRFGLGFAIACLGVTSFSQEVKTIWHNPTILPAADRWSAPFQDPDVGGLLNFRSPSPARLITSSEGISLRSAPNWVTTRVDLPQEFLGTTRYSQFDAFHSLPYSFTGNGQYVYVNYAGALWSLFASTMTPLFRVSGGYSPVPLSAANSTEHVVTREILADLSASVFGFSPGFIRVLRLHNNQWLGVYAGWTFLVDTNLPYQTQTAHPRGFIDWDQWADGSSLFGCGEISGNKWIRFDGLSTNILTSVDLPAPPIHVRATPNKSHVVVALNNGVLQTYTTAGVLVKSTPNSAGGGYANNIAISPDSNTIFVLNQYGDVLLYNTTTHARTGTITSHHGFVQTTAYSRDGAKLLTVGFDGTIQVRNATTGGLIAYSTLFRGIGANCAAWSADGTKVYVGLRNRNLMVLNSSNLTISSASQYPAQINSISASNDGLRLAVAANNNRVYLVRLSTFAIERTLNHDYAPAAVAFSPNSAWLAVGTWDSCWLWTVSNGKLARKLIDGFGYHNAIGWRSVSNELTFGGFDGYLYRYTTTGVRLRTYYGHDDTVTSINYLADGTIVSAGYDARIKKWAATNANQLWVQVPDEPLAMQSASVSPNGQRMAYSVINGGVGVFDLTFVPPQP